MPECIAAPIMTGDSATGTVQKVTVSSGEATLTLTTKLSFDKAWEKIERITNRGNVVLSFDVRGAADGSISGRMDVDPSFSGSIHEITVSGKVHDELRLTMDGKPLSSIPWTTLEQNPGLLAPGGFADGSPLPVFAPEMKRLLDDLTKKAADASSHCAASAQVGDGPGMKALSTPPGHGGEPGDNAPNPDGCRSCKRGCYVQFNAQVTAHDNLIGCLITDTGACYALAAAAAVACTAAAGPLGGLLCGVVMGGSCGVYKLVTDCIPVVTACLASCDHGQACCGNPCGDVCCGNGTCVAPGTCCPAGNQLCTGTERSSCYDPTKESCLATGEGCQGQPCDNNTLCCPGFSKCIHPIGAVEFCCDIMNHVPCGTALCCDAGTCVGDGRAHPYQCCDTPDQACGNNCCAAGERCIGGKCTTEEVDCSCHTSPCIARYACNAPGKPTVCCLAGQACASGQCCPIGQIDCQGVCSSQTCVR